ncbi:MAG: hypothetical protein M0019_07315 [Actinomycetota bacterium]|nr:hypothetical protein [Actinomycetota bacterium]
MSTESWPLVDGASYFELLHLWIAVTRTIPMARRLILFEISYGNAGGIWKRSGSAKPKRDFCEIPASSDRYCNNLLL